MPKKEGDGVEERATREKERKGAGEETIDMGRREAKGEGKRGKR